MLSFPQSRRQKEVSSHRIPPRIIPPSCTLHASFFGWIIFSQRGKTEEEVKPERKQIIKKAKKLRLFLYNPATNTRIGLPPYNAFGDDISHPRSMLLSSPPEGKSCVLIVRTDGNRLIFCRPRAVGAQWSPIYGPGAIYRTSRYMIACRGKAYFLYPSRQHSPPIRYELGIFSSDRYGSGFARIVRLKERYADGELNDDHGLLSLCTKGCFLLESSGDVLAVCLYSTNDHPEFETRVTFRVYKVEFEKGKWSRVQDLQDRILYVGEGSSVSVSAQSVGGRGNQIFFALSESNQLSKCTPPTTLVDGRIEMKILLCPPNSHWFQPCLI